VFLGLSDDTIKLSEPEAREESDDAIGVFDDESMDVFGAARLCRV
jgi:hypothetical protein